MLSKYIEKFFEGTTIPRTQPLQKYIKLERFLQGLNSNTSTFVEPKNWDDPFEDFISKLTNKQAKAYTNTLNITQGIYAQSWISKKSECDGMWRNFATLDNGVLIHTTLEKVITSLFQYLLNSSAFVNQNIYQNSPDIQNTLLSSINIRKIQYLSDKNIADLFTEKTLNACNDYDEVALNLLSKKRKEFEYENEYRLFVKQALLHLPTDKYLQLGYFKDYIDDIVFSPTISKLNFESNKKLLITNYGFTKKQITKSKLYDINAFKKEYNL